MSELTDDGVDHIVIESQGSRLDGRDRSTILDFAQRSRPSPALSYEWRTKSEPLLRYADALAGVAREYLTDGQTQHFERLQQSLVVSGVHYVGA